MPLYHPSQLRVPHTLAAMLRRPVADGPPWERLTEGSLYACQERNDNFTSGERCNPLR
jgi:hypothetical protein